MSTTFMSAPKLLLTSESVTEGHPDKMCDQISDGVLDAIYAKDPLARVACETAATTGIIAILGEITTTAYFDAQAIVRETIETNRLHRFQVLSRLQNSGHHRLAQRAIARYRAGRGRCARSARRPPAIRLTRSAQAIRE